MPTLILIHPESNWTTLGYTLTPL